MEASGRGRRAHNYDINRLERGGLPQRVYEGARDESTSQLKTGGAFKGANVGQPATRKKIRQPDNRMKAVVVQMQSRRPKGQPRESDLFKDVAEEVGKGDYSPALMGKIVEARKVDPHTLDEQQLDDDFNKQEKFFNDQNTVFIRIAEKHRDWGPNSKELKKMRSHLEEMILVREKAEIRRDYEGQTYCGKDTKWCARRLGTFMDFAVSGATAAVLIEETVVDVWNQVTGTVESWINPVEASSSVYNYTTLTSVPTTSAVVTGSASYYVIGMIAASIAASKMRDHLHAKAIAYEKRMGILEDLDARAELLLKEASARCQFWEKCSLLYYQRKKISERQYRDFRKIQQKMKEYGGTDDPMYRHGRNLILQRKSFVEGAMVDISAGAGQGKFTLTGTPDFAPTPLAAFDPDDFPEAVGCCGSVKKPQAIKTLKDLLDVENELTRIREGITDITKQANELTDGADARAADYYVIILQLQNYYRDMQVIFKDLNSMPKVDFKATKKETCGEVLVQTVLELGSLVTITLSEYEQEVGQQNKVMQYIGVGAFSAGFIFSRIRDRLSTDHFNELQRAKHQRRLLALEPITHDLKDLIIIFSAHQEYRRAQGDGRRKKAFRRVVNMTKHVPGNVLGVELGKMKENLALTTDADVLFTTDNTGNRKAIERKRYLETFRRQVERKVRKQTTGQKKARQYKQSQENVKLLRDNVDLSSTATSAASQSLGKRQRFILKQSSAADLDRLIQKVRHPDEPPAPKEMVSYADSPHLLSVDTSSRSDSRSTRKSLSSSRSRHSTTEGSAFSYLTLGDRAKVRKELRELQGDNRLCNWSPVKDEDIESPGTSGAETEMPGYRRVLTDIESGGETEGDTGPESDFERSVFPSHSHRQAEGSRLSSGRVRGRTRAAEKEVEARGGRVRGRKRAVEVDAGIRGGGDYYNGDSDDSIASCDR